MDYKKMTDDELIDRMICPVCYERLKPYIGCLTCFNCGWEACG